MSEKAKVPEFINKNISHKPIDYEKLNRLTEDFGKRFTPQQELSSEQAFWLRMSDPTSKPSDALPVKIKAPKELPKISLVKESLKKLKFHFAKFDDGEKSKEENVKHDYCEIETKNMELENSVAKLFLENESLYNETNHIKQVFKEQFDSIKKTHVHTKEQSDSLIDKLNLKSAENEDLKAQIQDKVAVTPKNKVKKVRFTEPLTSSSNIKHVESSNTSDSDTPVLSSIGLKCSTSKYGSKPTGNKRNDRISQTPSRNIKNKVEAQPRKVNKKNCVDKQIHNVDVKHSQLNANSEPICATCKKSLFDCVHDMCFIDFVKNVNSHAKYAKKHKKENIWRPTGHVFTEVGLNWKPTGRTFTIIGNLYPLTRITLANVVPPKKTTFHSVKTQKPELKDYSRKPKIVKNVGSSKKAKIVESKNANHSEPNHTWGSNATDIPSSSSLVMTGCPDCSLLDSGTTILQELWGMVTISWEMLLFQEYTTTLNKLAKDGLTRGIPRLKFQKDHLCSTCALGKGKKSSHQPKAEDTNQEKLYLLHMDLCGPMRVIPSDLHL
ncbi:hypothetical protein Tco_1154787 [Tanacetum coccineum]